MRTLLAKSYSALLITMLATTDGVAQPSTLGQRAAGAAKQQPAAASHAATAPRVAARPITIVSPRRAALMNQLRAIREEQNSLASAVSTGRDDNPSRVAQPASVSPWPKAPVGARAIATTAGSTTAFGIHAINGRTKGIRLTAGGKVVITGLGLGAPTGVRLVGGALDRYPVLLRINWRTPTRIDAEILSMTRGSPDEQKAAVEVRTSQGATYRFEGVSFIAAREEITITDVALMRAYVSFIDLAKGKDWWRQTSTDGRGGYREDGGKDMNCGPPGTDAAHFKRRFGFDVVGASMATGRTDSGDGDMNGNSGSRVFTPGYSFGDWVDENFNHDFLDSPSVNSASVLSVNWGVFRSHRSPKVGVDPYYGGSDEHYDRSDPVIGLVDSKDAFDQCFSAWSFTSLTLYGPAGVRP